MNQRTFDIEQQVRGHHRIASVMRVVDAGRALLESTRHLLRRGVQRLADIHFVQPPIQLPAKQQHAQSNCHYISDDRL